MSTIEDRLSAALEAKASQVRHEDLRPADPPRVVVPLSRRTSTWLVAAAACAALVITPVVVLGGDGDDRPAPPVDTPTAPVTPNGDEVKGADWPVVATYGGYDVDGDGVEDRVVTRTRSGEDLTTEDWRLEVQFSAGGTAAVLLSGVGFENVPVEPVDLDGDGGDEILYYNGREAGEMGVLQYADGVLRDLDVPDDPGLTSQTDGQGRIRARWVADGVLWSSRSVEGGSVPGVDGSGPRSPYEVELWTWRLDGQQLVAEPQDNQCVEAIAVSNPFPCGEGPGPLPGTQPEATSSIGTAEYFETDVNADGVDDTIALEGPTPQERGQVEEGEVLLVVSLGGGGELTSPVPAGWTPDVRTTTVASEAGDGLLLRQEGGDATTMALYLVRGGELVVADVPRAGIRFGSGFEGTGDATQRWDTYVTTDGRLWSRSLTLSEDTPEDRWTFYEWGIRGSSLVPDDLPDMGCWEC